jgi:hypothetical protein
VGALPRIYSATSGTVPIAPNDKKKVASVDKLDDGFYRYIIVANFEAPAGAYDCELTTDRSTGPSASQYLDNVRPGGQAMMLVVRPWGPNDGQTFEAFVRCENNGSTTQDFVNGKIGAVRVSSRVETP